MRHAKTESLAGSDHDRQLTERGRHDARTAGAWLSEQGLSPAVVLVSSAVRARQTSDEVWAAMATTPDVRVLESLYLGDEDDAMEAIATEIPAGAAIVAVVGHNPTVTMLANLLQVEGDRADIALPTAALAVLSVPTDWADLAPGVATLISGYRAGD